MAAVTIGVREAARAETAEIAAVQERLARLARLHEHQPLVVGVSCGLDYRAPDALHPDTVRVPTHATPSSFLITYPVLLSMRLRAPRSALGSVRPACSLWRPPSPPPRRC